ncbi:MAG: tetratricopeptide repeat protein [Bacteroidales bacterium]|nr:tetratricopeptide repeat protein [Bacteroidales bacterium]
MKKIAFYFLLLNLSISIAACNQSNQESGNEKEISMPVTKNQPVLNGDPAIYEFSLKTDSLNTELRLQLAALYYSAKMFDKALYHNQIVNKINPSNMAAIFNLGNIHYDLGENEKAIDYYEKFLAFDKTNCNVRCDLATCYMRMKNNQKAIALLRENVRIDEKHPQTHYNLSVILNLEGMTSESQKELDLFNMLTGNK